MGWARAKAVHASVLPLSHGLCSQQIVSSLLSSNILNTCDLCPTTCDPQKMAEAQGLDYEEIVKKAEELHAQKPEEAIPRVAVPGEAFGTQGPGSHSCCSVAGSSQPPLFNCVGS